MGKVDGNDEVHYSGIAFPRFADYGDGAAGVEQLAGVSRPLTTGFGGRYALDQDAAPEARPGQPSQWDGASGAAVFCAGVLIGVVARNASDLGTHRLYATRVDALFYDAEFSRLIEADTGSAPRAEPVGTDQQQGTSAAIAHLEEGGRMCKLGLFADAETAYRVAIVLAPALAIAHAYLSASLYNLKRYPEAGGRLPGRNPSRPRPGDRTRLPLRSFGELKAVRRGRGRLPGRDSPRSCPCDRVRESRRGAV
jgi:hypothetical protein